MSRALPHPGLRRAGRALAAAVACALTGCAGMMYPVPPVEFPTGTAPAIPSDGPTQIPPLRPVAPVQAQAVATGGSLYSAASYRPLFEDYRARHMGDTLTVQIVEKINASQTATSTIDKTGSVKGSVSALPFISPNAFSRGSAVGEGYNSFEGKGATESTNEFSGTMTAMVIGVLPNGHLMIAGEKQIGVNQHVDVLRFTGQVDPRAIQPGNVISSPQIANVRVEHRGRGAMADAQGIGWLARFFLNLLPI